MQTSVRNEVELSLLDRQREIQSRCYHPQGSFEPFERADIEQSVSARFEQQVEKYPDRLAVKTDERELTYAQLNRIANHIAHSILAECYDSTAPVVLFLEHGIPMVCGILAVLKAGKSYVPLDPLYPRARNAYMLSDSQAGLMVTDTVNLGYATELTQYRVPLVNVDEIETKEPAEDLGLPVSPDQVAYILYTSGSTGQPKGVYQNHRNLLHYLAHFTNTLHICRHDRIALLYSFNVNGHLRGTFGALLNGAALFTYDIKAKGLTGLADWLQREEITVYHSVPTVFRHLMDTLKGDERFPHVRLIRLGGEPVPARNVALYKRHFPAPCILYTALGSTETSTIRHYFTDHESEMAASAVPTGFAVEERETILLDDQEQEVGIGEVGQIAVKSRYLALGYWGKPALTQKAFRPAPDDDRARIYLTGDLGRILPDGRMIYMGRKDAQVKVRGFRVETVGIEATLLQHPRIKEAAVITWPDGLGDNYLAAYTVPYQDDPPTTRELHEFVRERLPDYMVPAAFVSLKTMPLTPNSKVNRRALPRPEKLRPELGTEYVAPHRPVEQALAEMWSEVLDIEQIGVEDNFFHLGGHSLRAAQIVSRIRDRFGIELPLRIIFEAPTVGSMADLVIQNQA
jgi:amino acid adenylation domain-containing protein